MRYIRVAIEIGGGLLALAFGVAAAGQNLPLLGTGDVKYPPESAPLSADQVARKLEERNAQRAAALEQFSSTRVYHMQYRGFPSDRDAEMVVKVTYNAPDTKQFTVVSQTGQNLLSSTFS